MGKNISHCASTSSSVPCFLLQIPEHGAFQMQCWTPGNLGKVVVHIHVCMCQCPWKKKNILVIIWLAGVPYFLFLYLASDWSEVNAEIDLIVLSLFPDSQSIKLVLFNQGSWRAFNAGGIDWEPSWVTAEGWPGEDGDPFSCAPTFIYHLEQHPQHLFLLCSDPCQSSQRLEGSAES